MPSASGQPQPGPRWRPLYPRSRGPLARAAALAACLTLIGTAFAGCETTQEKAAKQQARAAHILEARAERKRHRADGRPADGPKTGHMGAKSAHRPGKEGR